MNNSGFRSAREQIAYLFVFIMFILITVFVNRNSIYHISAEFIPLDSGWTLESGEDVTLEHLPTGEQMISIDVRGLSLNGRALCFKSIDTNFKVYADGKDIYSYTPVLPKRLGISYGMYVHTVELPEKCDTVSMQFLPVFPETAANLGDVVFGDSGTYMNELYMKNLFAFGQSCLTVLIGIFFLIIALNRTLFSHSAGIDFVAFGATCVMVGFIGFNDTLLLQMLTGQPALIRLFTYVCLMLVPFPVLTFLASTTGNSHSRLLPFMMTICLINFAVQVLITYSGISDYYHLVKISHAIIVLDFVFAVSMVIRGTKKKTISQNIIKSVIIGLSACIVGIVVDLIRYHFSKSYGSSAFTRIGLFVFVVLMSIYLFKEQTRSIKEKQQEHVKLTAEITEAFARVIDMKDSYTNGHSTRVAKYTAMLAGELGYDKETVDIFYRIALLHDVGKIGIPEGVLNNPGKLTDEEYQIIQSHTVKGYEVLKDISIMPDLAIGAEFHHERPDGKGYPKGLKGGEIPRVAQIIAVADCFDAMYSDRPYRKRMNFERAVSIIKEVSGTQLTPDVVDAFLRLVEKGEFRLPDDFGGGSMEDIDNIRKGFK